MPAEGGYVIASQIFTVLYFGFFVALFVVGLFERPKALPISIADAVLAASAKNGSAARMAAATAAEPNVKG
jgi:ubiquinol-cytochrome c reductase cytochrome b subunit